MYPNLWLPSLQLGVVTQTGLPAHPAVHGPGLALPRWPGLQVPGHGLLRRRCGEEVQPVWPQVWQQDRLSSGHQDCKFMICIFCVALNFVVLQIVYVASLIHYSVG